VESEVLALEIMPDHLHLFLSATPQCAPNQLIGRLKGKSARLLRQEIPELLSMPSLWTRSFFCSTAGNVSSETIARYIAEQPTRV
jgi:putative transposase